MPPYEVGKPQHRVQTLNELAKQLSLNIVYVNQVGGQDDLIFDGRVLVSNHNGQLALQAPSFQNLFISLNMMQKQKLFKTAKTTPPLDTFAEIYQALVMATRDYKNVQASLA